MTALQSVSLAHSLRWHEAQGSAWSYEDPRSLNVAYEMGAYGLPLRATEEKFVVFSFALPLSVDLSGFLAITAP
jgi:hypothetical protein